MVIGLIKLLHLDGKNSKQEKCKVTSLMLNCNFTRRTAGSVMHK